MMFKSKKIHRICTAFLAGSMAAALAACGKGGDASDKGQQTADTAQPEYSYVAEYVDLNVGEEADFYRTQFVDDKLYYHSYHYDETSAVSTQTLHIYSFEDEKDVASFVLSENKNDEEVKVYRYVDSYAVRSDGSVAMIENTYDNSDEMNPKRTAVLCLYDKDFNRGEALNLMETLKIEEDNFYVNQFLCDSEDRLYVIAESKIYLFDTDLSYKGSVDSGDSWINLSGRGKDGRVYVSMYDQGSNSQVVRLVDFDQKKLGEAHDHFVGGNGNSLTPGLEGDFLVSDGTRVYDYSLDTNQATELFTWLDCDIFGDYVRSMFVTEDGKIAAMMSDWSTGESSMAYLSKVKTEGLVQKTQITLGALYSEQELQAAAVAFNKQSDKYHININYYMDRNEYSEDAYENGRTALNNALISSDAPDMVLLSGANVTALAAKGAFEDLSGYLEQSSVLNREDYLENVLAAGTYYDCLVYIPKRFYVQTLVGKTADVGEQSGWSISDIMTLAAQHPDASLFEYGTKESMLDTCLTFNGDAFIDYSTGKCSFDSEEFKKILEFVSAFPDEYDWSEDRESLPTLLAEGKVLLERVHLSGFEDIQLYPAMFNTPVTYIGYPTTDGSAGCILNTYGGVAITSGAREKEGAWAFMEFYLNRDDEMFASGLPSQKKAMQELIDKELTVEYVKDENGDLVLDDDGNPIPEDNHGGVGFDDWEYTFHNCTQEEIAQVQEIISEAKASATVDSQILAMITEEAAPYFRKQKSVDEVANVIQSRVQLYLNETL